MTKLPSLLLWLCFYSSAAYSQISQIKIVNLRVNNTLPAKIDDWQLTAGSLVLVAQKSPGVQLKEPKLVVQIKSNGAFICGNSVSSASSISSFDVKTFTTSELTGMLNGCKELKDGSYQLCVQFFNLDRIAISNEMCKEFKVETPKADNYTAPTLISPENGKVFSVDEMKRPLNFRWTPVVPKPKEAVTYRLKVWQLMQGQNGSQAMRSNQPIVVKDVDNITQATVSGIYTGPCRPPYLCDYVWRVEAIMKDGIVLGSSEPTVFKISNTYAINLDSLKIGCPQNGTYSYSIKVSNPNTTIALFDKLEIVKVNGVTVTPTLITTVTPAHGATIPASGSITATGTFTYAGVVNNLCIKGYIKEQLNPTLNQASTFICDTLNCGCNFCTKNVEFDNDQPKVTYSGNTLNILHPLWNMSGATLVGVKAEIIEFDRYVGDECMTCNKDASIWGNFISGTYGVPGAFAVATGTVTGNTHHSIYFSGPGLGIPFNLNISTPPLSNLSCCCDKITVTIRYTFIFKDASGDCKYCSQIFKYNYQKGTCQNINTDGSTGTINNTKNN